MAKDRRLSRDRVVELFDDPQTAEAAAANPNLPVDLMERILADAVDLPRRPDDAAIVLGA
jgi:hypothetical protein